MYIVKFVLLTCTCMVSIFRLLFFVLQFIATYFGEGIIFTISLHVIFNKCIQTLSITECVFLYFFNTV